MNVERLHTIVRALKAEVDSTAVVSALERLSTYLQNLVNSPQQPEAQQGVADVLTELRRDLPEAPSETFPPSWLQTLDELGVADLFGSQLLGTVNLLIEQNQMTPSVALGEIRPLADRVKELDSQLTALISALDFLGVPTEDLEPGEVEFSVLIPRAAVDNDLPDLAKEFLQIQRIVGPFLELGTGSRPDLKVRAIASSDFGAYLDMAPQAAAFLAVATERLVALYRNVLDIRLKRQELADSGVPDSALAGIEAHASEAIEKGIDEEVERLAAQVADMGDRVNELKIELRLSLNAIANRIDQGYNFDVRAEPMPSDEGDEGEGEEAGEAVPDPAQAAVATIRGAAPGLKFIAPLGKPILSLPESKPSEDGTTTD